MEDSSLRQRPLAHSKDPQSSQQAPTPDAAIHHLENTYPPFVPPTNLTINQLLSVIPTHCFERSTLTSLRYVGQDVALMVSLWYLASLIDTSFGIDGGVMGNITKWSAWSGYWVVQSFVMTGLWVIGHECGHRAFSPSKRINDLVGLIIHSFLLVPYHSWRISHAKHHASTGNLEKDQVFVPKTLEQLGGGKKGKKVRVAKGIELDELLEDAPMYRFVELIGQQLLGWPVYLFFNVSGQPSYPKGTNHFNPNSIIFDRRHRSLILLSDAALLVTLSFFYFVAHCLSSLGVLGTHSPLSLFTKFYFIPYLLVNHWLVLITYLQHTSPLLPHYRASHWSFLLGALTTTIDRNFLGPVGKTLLHGISETHILHHLCSKIPHYHAEEATEAIKQYLEETNPGVYLEEKKENVLISLWKTMGECKFVDGEGGVVMYRDAYGRQRRKVEMKMEGADSGVEGI
ncbi:uncharacterized protein JCM6883_002640 [Sporobolomyces salmoneus]|uniref:uncharacterized protein n=1 Tax=Sporobolomyces salmoneus TaxID=183962 RepID=UPI0031750FE1